MRTLLAEATVVGQLKDASAAQVLAKLLVGNGSVRPPNSHFTPRQDSRIMTFQCY
jgi:hypothetical protein